MKFLYLILILPAFVFAQYPDETETTKNPTDNYTIKDNVIYWQKIYQGNPENINHPKLKDNKATNCQLPKCQGCAYIMGQEFNFDYKIESKEDRYRVTAYNFRFNNDIQYSIVEGVTVDSEGANIEAFMLKLKNGEFRKNSIAMKGLSNLDAYLTDVFKPETTTPNEDW